MSENRSAEATLTTADREWLASVRAAGSLRELARVVGVSSGHDAYLAAKPRWYTLRGRELAVDGRANCDGGSVTEHDAADGVDSLPGSCTMVDGRAFHVHGITHADTDAERATLRAAVKRALADGASVYCEQGIRRLYLADTEACAMDDYRWAMARCKNAGIESHVTDLLGETADPSDAWTVGGDSAEPDASHVDPFVDDGPEDEPTVETLRTELRNAALSLLESDADDGASGELRRSLRDVVSAFPPSHEDMGTARDTEAMRLRRAAAADPTELAPLQRYYERAFLPQSLEREWLARHDPELEIVTHARNARMADYAIAHAETGTDREDHSAVHLIVGAAHGPGVREYLERHRDGRRELDGFTPV